MVKKLQKPNLATKADLKQLEDKLGGKIDEVEQNLGEKLDKIANTLDGFVGRVDDLTIENQVGANQIKELGDKVNSHEARLTKLESPQPSP